MKKFFKIAGIGCLSIIGFFVISGILVGIFSSDTETELNTETKLTTENNKSKTIVIDSIQLKKEEKRKDSLLAVKKQKRKKAERDLKKFKKKEDEFEGNAFYRDPRTPYYANVNFIYPYIGEKDNYYWLRLKFQYASDSWLFIKNGTLLVDGEKFEITGKWEKDHNSGIWEWLDISVGASERIILDKIVNSKSAKIRYVGTKYHDDRKITSKEKSIIRKTLEIYDNLK
ncbi:hypothetical protein [Tenacibaculum finnmarkense]|uniref:hypothetical protein n=1 Tax=Tenacibaculum finnmarkense TaxID=2781243 RepID=UPI001EFAA8CB|nr:hypothetical protein [Tenacibaculum finnmarkense]MCG8210648.1 hypothetical protein [Tenacibaculum finnmarkense genomovar finnmarkense]MCG8226269.1 hypothetical protein [Tenacibaculum finnmarkense genomovar finnmarkense]MCG8716154.1 hypothetical protein [Tenacibaculum finnmarkense]MCG8736971.1 hypothetical protein [Tenacibaculum finnmarkense]MCG8768406.1 hypothetical protein [Tenacibaculum finnmarkense]